MVPRQITSEDNLKMPFPSSIKLYLKHLDEAILVSTHSILFMIK